jgi:hypothetical protein
MVDVLPLFRFQMGSQNSYFPEARADRVVVKHLPIDFRTRYEAGEVGALRAEFRRIFQARFPHVAELLTEGWATQYINDALRFCDTERMRVITAYKSDPFWAETAASPRTWKTVTEGDGEAQVTVELAMRDLSQTGAMPCRTVGGWSMPRTPGLGTRWCASARGPGADRRAKYLIGGDYFSVTSSLMHTTSC